MPLTIKRTNITSIAANSVLFNGTNDYLSVARILDNSTDVTIEAWVRATSTPPSNSGYIVSQYVSAGANRTIFSVQANLTVLMQFGATNVGSTTILALNTWYHLAFVRSGSGANNFSIYINGVRDGQMTYTGTFQNTPTTIGGTNNLASTYFPGYISNLRILKGTALYTGASFSVPTSPLTAIANTALLTCNSATIVDSSTNNFTITNNGSATVSSINPFRAPINNFQFVRRTPTVIGKSVQFNGTNQYLSVGSVANWAFLNNGSTPFTIEAWINPTSVSAPSGQMIVSTTGYQAQIGFYFEIGNYNNGDVLFAICDGRSKINQWATSNNFLTANTLTHVAVSFTPNGTNVPSATVKFFVNGILATSSNVITNTTTYSTSNPTNTLLVGAYQTPFVSYFSGKMNNLRILNGTALYTTNFTPPTAPLTAISGTSLLTCNAATIVDSSTNNFTITNNNGATVSSVSPFVASSGGMSLKKVFADPATLVTNGLVLNLDASNISSYPSSGTSWFDLSGNNNTGTLINGPTFNSANGGSIVFDGVDDYVDLGNISQLKPTTQITVSTWVYRSTMNDSQNEAIIGCTQGGGYELYYTANKMKFYVYAGGSYRIPEMSTSAISSWMNFTATYDNRYAKLYHNGVLQNTVDSGATNNISYVANNILIGAEAGAGSARETGFEWTGNIAQTLIYNRALSAPEVLQNYNVTKARFGL